MSSIIDRIRDEVRQMPAPERADLVDALICDLSKPSSELDRAWAEESAKRFEQYKTGMVKGLTLDEVIRSRQIED